jgi:hypothetical protein
MITDHDQNEGNPLECRYLFRAGALPATRIRTPRTRRRLPPAPTDTA